MADTEAERIALERYRLLLPYFDGSTSVAALARKTGIAERTLWHWLKAFNTTGLSAFQRKGRSDRGKSRSARPDLSKLIEGLVLRRPPPTVAFVHRHLSDICKTQGWSCPSYSTVARRIKAIDPAIRVLAHDGSKAYKQQYDLIFRREAVAPNEIWQSDHTPLDLFVLDAQGKEIRPWLTIILDEYSRAIPAYYLAADAPTTWKTALTLRQAILRKDDPRWQVFGIPASFYTDHGSDFTSNRMLMVAAALKMQLINSQVAEPRGRGKIERFFRSVNELFLCSLPGFVHNGHRKKGNLISFEELDRLFREWLLGNYMNRVHSETGSTPQCRWENSDFIPRVPDSLEQLDLLLCTDAQQRKVHRDGIRFHGFRYMDVNLSGYIGEEVTIRYDPRDLAELRVFARDEFICRVVCQEIAGQQLSLKAIVKARNAERRRRSDAIKESVQLSNEFIAMHSSGISNDRHENKSQTRLKRYRTD